MIGRFAAIASISTLPNPSDSVVEKANISVSPSNLATLFVVPTNISSGFKDSFNIFEGFCNENDHNWKKSLPVKFI